MYQVVVSYEHPENPDAFVEHYSTVHAPLARKMPGVQTFEWMVCESMDGATPPHFVIARLAFASKEAAGAAFAWPEGAEALADLANFAAAGVAVDAGEVRD